MKRLLLTLTSVAVLLSLTIAPASAARHAGHPVAKKADLSSCFANWNSWMGYVHAGGGPGGGNTYAAVSQSSCDNNYKGYFVLETCMQQLLSTGWSVINSSCNEIQCSYASGCAGLYEPSHWVGLTKGRWYDVWAYQNVEGYQGVFSKTWGGTQG